MHTAQTILTLRTYTSARRFAGAAFVRQDVVRPLLWGAVRWDILIMLYYVTACYAMLCYGNVRGFGIGLGGHI